MSWLRMHAMADRSNWTAVGATVGTAGSGDEGWDADEVEDGEGAGCEHPISKLPRRTTSVVVTCLRRIRIIRPCMVGLGRASRYETHNNRKSHVSVTKTKGRPRTSIQLSLAIDLVGRYRKARHDAQRRIAPHHGNLREAGLHTLADLR